MNLFSSLSKMLYIKELIMKKYTFLIISGVLALILYACSKDSIYEADNSIKAVENLTLKCTGPNSVELEWKFPDNSQCSFRLDKKTNESDWVENYAELNGDMRNWTDTSVELDQILYYRLFTIYENNLSEEKVISFNNKIASPSGLTTIVLGESSIQLNWTDDTFDEAGTIIDRKESTDSLWKEVFTTPENIVTWLDINRSPGIFYSYRVKAYFKTYTSEYSNESQNSTTATSFIYVPSGTFTMGSNNNTDEQPAHQVTISRGFLIGKYEVTQKEWNDLMSGYTAHIEYPYGYGKFGTGDDYPIYFISWYSTLVYCNARSIAEGLAPCYSIKGSTDPSAWGLIPEGYDEDWESAVLNTDVNGYRLPTEAEWEYAARYGDNRIYPWGNDLPSAELANFGDNAGFTTPVGSYPLGNSKLGMCDMAGNVWEHCWDKADVYSADSVTDPTGSPEPSPFTYNARILRGGSWYHSHDKTTLRSCFRNITSSGMQSGGFRIVKLP